LFKPIYVGGRPVGLVVGGSALTASVEFENLERCQVRATSHKDGALVKSKFIGRNTNAESKSLFRVWQWVICSGVLPDDELFTRYSFNPKWKKVRYTRKVFCWTAVVAALKKAAEDLGFNPSYFLSHSLRKGGLSEEVMNDRGNYKEGSKVGRAVYDYSAQGRGAYSSGTVRVPRLTAKDIRALVPEA
jgi:hypothetical protein